MQNIPQLDQFLESCQSWLCGKHLKQVSHLQSSSWVWVLGLTLLFRRKAFSHLSHPNGFCGWRKWWQANGSYDGQFSSWDVRWCLGHLLQWSHSGFCGHSLWLQCLQGTSQGQDFPLFWALALPAGFAHASNGRRRSSSRRNLCSLKYLLDLKYLPQSVQRRLLLFACTGRWVLCLSQPRVLKQMSHECEM